MNKIIKFSNLDCANCASKIERKISRIYGVNSVNINFIFQKMELDIDQTLLEDVMKDIDKICKKEDIDYV